MDIISLSNNLNKCGIVDNKNNFNISSKKDLLMQSLINFFAIKENLDNVIPIITGKSKISLRILDWFVTNYSKKNNITYQLELNKKNLN